MKKVLLSVWFTLAFSSFSFGQLTKDQVYGMVDAGMDVNMITAIIRKNCVDFELNGDTVVDLSQKVPPEVLRSIVDCRDQLKETAAVVKPVATAIPVESEAATKAADAPRSTTSPKGMPVPEFVTVKVESNRSSFLVEGVEIRFVPQGMEDQSTEALEKVTHRYRFIGESIPDEDFRLVQTSKADTWQNRSYVGYLVMNGSRKKGLFGKRSERTDIVRFVVKRESDGQVYFEIRYEESKFSDKESVNVKAIGPLTIHNQQHLAIDGTADRQNLEALFP